tara:strand:+ start:7180 stop:7644 length:465 start_codon:yes stop_codon:yes gene_type:complete
MVKKIFILIFLLSINLDAELFKSPQNYLSPENISLDNEAMIYSVSASFNNMSLKSIKIEKPSKLNMSKYHTLSKKDKYAMRALNEDGKEVLLIGLGDPFYFHVDHIGYEDSEIFGGYIDQEFEIAIPLTIQISHLVLLSQDEFGFKEIKKIEVN